MKKKILSILLVLCMVLTLVPPAAFAAEPVSYLDADGTAKPCTQYTVVTSSALQWGSSGETTWYVAQGDVTINDCVTVKGNVHLILTDGCSLTVNGGIRVEDDVNNVENGIATTLTVYGQSVPVLKADGAVDETNNRTGRLTANGSGIWGIGSNTATGNITINGGIVTAEGGTAEQDSCGIMAHDITVNGGIVTAEGGTAEKKSCGIAAYDITVNGGSVTAFGGKAYISGGISGG